MQRSGEPTPEVLINLEERPSKDAGVPHPVSPLEQGTTDIEVNQNVPGTNIGEQEEKLLRSYVLWIVSKE